MAILGDRDSRWRAMQAVIAVLPLWHALAAQATPPEACRVTVTARSAINRSLPESFYDQGRTSLPLVHPRHRLLAERRSGTIGKVVYSRWRPSEDRRLPQPAP